MIDILGFRLRYGPQTVAFPDGPPRFPTRFRGRPAVDPARCPEGCAACADACPTEAIADAGRPSMAIDLGRCLFCGDCATACPPGAVTFTQDHRLAARTREELVVSKDEPLLARALDADGIVVTGPVSDNMKLALRKTWEAVPAPRLVIAVGACAISGGPFRGSAVVAGGAQAALGDVPVDLFVPGCPPHPITFLDGLLRLLGRL